LNSLRNPRTGVRKIVWNAGQIGLARFVTLACRAIYLVIAARMLGAEAYGSLGVAIAWTLSFLPLVTFGLGPYLIAELSSDKAASPRVLSQTLSLTAVGAVLAGITAAGVGIAFEPDALIRMLVIVCALAMMGRGIVRWSEHVFLAYERPSYTLRQETIFRSLELSIVALVLLAGGDALAVAAIGATCWLLEAASGIRLVRKRVARHPLRRDFSAVWMLLISAAPLLITQLCAQGLYHYPLVFARNLLGDRQAVGNVALAMQALIPVAMLPGALAQVAMPALVRSQGRGDGRDIDFIATVIRSTLIATAACVIGAAAVGPSLVPLVMGTQYALAGELLWLPMLMLAPLTLYFSSGTWLFAGRRYTYAAVSGCLAVLVLALSAQVLIPWLGPAGVFLAAATGHLSGTLARFIPLLITGTAAFGVQTRNAFLAATAAVGGYGLWAWAGWPVLPGCVLCLGLLSLATFRWCLKPGEQQFLASIWAQRLGLRTTGLKAEERQ